jgi:hypothetical protein
MRFSSNAAGLSLLVLTGMGVAGPTAAQAPEPLPVFSASKLLPRQMLTGPNYRIEDTVRNDGFANHYTFTVDGTPYIVIGDALADVRVRELQALAQMEQLRRSQIYANAMKNAAVSPLHLAKDLVLEPVGTVRDTVTGVGDFFRGVGGSLFRSRGEQEDGMAKAALGVSSAKREFAAKFGIDPYTTFPPVRERLNEIGWASAAGDLTVGAGFSAISGPAGTVLGASKTTNSVRNLIYDRTPVELEEVNRGKLRAAGVSDGVAEVFLDHPKYSPTVRTVLAEALADMRVPGADAFVQRAVLAQDEPTAFLMQCWAELFAAYHQQVARGSRFVRLGQLPALQRADGILVVMLPVDHLAWTSDMAGRYATSMQSLRQIQGVTGGEFWIDGTISPQARLALEQQNWKVEDNARTKLRL